MFDKHIAKKYGIKRNCHSCLYRHGCSWDFDGIFTDKVTGEHVWDNCKHWKLGKCYKCKYVDEPDDQEWYKRECEAYCFGGCSKFRRTFKQTEQFKELINQSSPQVNNNA